MSNLLSPQLLLHLLQRFSKYSNQVEQIHSLLTTNGYFHITDQWINTLLYNTLIRAYLNLRQPRTTLLLFTHMLHHQAPPNNHTFPSVLKAITSISSPYLGFNSCCSFHGQCAKRGIVDDPFVQTSLMSVYSQMGDLSSAYKVFDEMHEPCIISQNAMLDAFGKNGEMGLAVSMFSGMAKRDIYSWTSVISGYYRNGCFREAIWLFGKMMVHEDVISGYLKPTEATFVSVLSSCANGEDGCSLNQGKQIHGYMIKIEKELSVFIGTSLIAFYGKMGCLGYAMNMFNSMAIKEVCTWNSIICSLASNGMERQVLDMFERMKSHALQPNEVTFVGVLSACARAKFVDLGLALFHSMSHDFNIAPRMEHYGCVVDLLGRAGLLEEAYRFVRSMPFKADATVLGALLSACRLHGAVELGNEVGRQLIHLQPYHSGRYVLLSSLFAGAEVWTRAAEFRKAMVDAGIQKVPAFSLVN
ncbi:putative pentatricopeptide repeat-containing protein At1g10330 [Olea europaea var. sylvestris]|uniref:putative pentatricopeptide repeat-containing protein At1g10330 n=1 Tax=Olea europaea var. sylvestris TaxID=158386 RepID=UPI000C1D777C|nr:putative pentatricopeptide repeat-containing protein At1g10330 [Olea europaea var. sylvestris]XP_022874376.1 putative pentatricopeptide repeat-containing protein At1g10330 [Olea europaea var. sylvestris]XP_022874378.1 putative pentatricopeptide repeat-containing protein At1g10330 [Olea europaea var. sylvestris]XP_022874379.1 putative pentatricopeptide repeat-containing protein At1g10330 [Olea europaea var. sylvestris]XP_022874380.1 putative pentatricopeptide repeat-containing protein At1g103